MSKPAIDITPGSDKTFLWSKAKNLDDFENEFSFKKVKVNGIFDFSRENQVEKLRNGEKGVEIITPFYTHVNEKDEPCGILVNRGWVPDDLKYLKMHYNVKASGEITGILYRGDPKTKYSIPNTPAFLEYTRVDPYDFSLVCQLPNRTEASQFMLLLVDEDEKARPVLPASPSVNDLTNWKISPQRH
jgi:cytochrome oxidase assembly protein ShyY1